MCVGEIKITNTVGHLFFKGYKFHEKSKSNVNVNFDKTETLIKDMNSLSYLVHSSHIVYYSQYEE